MSARRLDRGKLGCVLPLNVTKDPFAAKLNEQSGQLISNLSNICPDWFDMTLGCARLPREITDNIVFRLQVNARTDRQRVSCTLFACGCICFIYSSAACHP